MSLATIILLGWLSPALLADSAEEAWSGQPNLEVWGAFEAIARSELRDAPAVPAPRPAPARRWAVGVQVAVTAKDYRSGDTFKARMGQAVGAALADSRIGPGDAKLVVLPEYVGTQLALSGEAAGVYTAGGKIEAIGRLLLANPGFGRYLLAASLRERRWIFDPHFIFASLLRYKAQATWTIYRETMSGLARGHGIVLVAGSLVLPPLDRLKDPKAPLYNSSFVFGPDGSLLQETRKVFLVEDEKPFTAPGQAQALTPAATPFGSVGNLICADGWYPQAFERFQEAEVLVQPSGGSGLPSFDKIWQGYNGAPNPADVDPRDIGTITEKAAWRKYSLVARIKSTRAKVGINPFLAGRLWDVDLGGWGAAVSLGPSGWELTEQPTVDGKDTFLYAELR